MLSAERYIVYTRGDRRASFYRAMLRRARLCHTMSSVCLSVCPLRTDRQTDDILWHNL